MCRLLESRMGRKGKPGSSCRLLRDAASGHGQGPVELGFRPVPGATARPGTCQDPYLPRVRPVITIGGRPWPPPPAHRRRLPFQRPQVAITSTAVIRVSTTRPCVRERPVRIMHRLIRSRLTPLFEAHLPSPGPGAATAPANCHYLLALSAVLRQLPLRLPRQLQPATISASSAVRARLYGRRAFHAEPQSLTLAHCPTLALQLCHQLDDPRNCCVLQRFFSSPELSTGDSNTSRTLSCSIRARNRSVLLAKGLSSGPLPADVSPW